MKKDFAVPSYVIPKSTKDNIAFLQGKVSEIALSAFEPSLPHIKDLLPFKGKWHIHLPYILPHDFYFHHENYTKENIQYTEKTRWVDAWKLAHTKQDIQKYCLATIKIVQHCQFLNPHLVVLHLPNASIPNAKKFLEIFLHTWEKYFPLSMLCLENVRNASHVMFKNLLLEKNCSLCFDMAHALTYAQTDTLNYPKLMEKVKIIHWSAPFEEHTLQKGKDKHLGLYHLKEHKKYCNDIITATPNVITNVLELFTWKEIEKSIPFFQQLS